MLKVRQSAGVEGLEQIDAVAHPTESLVDKLSSQVMVLDLAEAVVFEAFDEIVGELLTLISAFGE